MEKSKMKSKLKLVISFVSGAIVSFLTTIVIIGATQNILTDEEYNDYRRIVNRDNLIVAYQEYYKDSIKLLEYITANYFTGNPANYIDSNSLTILKNDIGLVEAMEEGNKSSEPSRFSISHEKD